MTVLITGFGPFDGGSNASQALVTALSAQTDRLRAAARAGIETLVLPVDTETVGDLLAEAVERVRPSRLLLTGQAAGRNRLSLEAFATNVRNFSVPDAAGNNASNLPVLDNGPERHAATWPDPEGAVAALNAAGIPAEISQDCGTHLCNQMLYLALHAAEETGMSYSATFLHVPLLPEQVIAGEPAAVRHAKCAYMPLDMTARGVEIILRHSSSGDAA